MFGSRVPQKPHTRSKRKRKPPWSDPSTLIIDKTATRYTIGPEGRKIIACGCEPVELQPSSLGERCRELRSRKGGAR